MHTFHKEDVWKQAFAGVGRRRPASCFPGPHFKATFDKQSGLLVSYRYKKLEYIHNGKAAPSSGRTPNIDNNDYLSQTSRTFESMERGQLLQPKAESFNVVRDKDTSRR